MKEGLEERVITRRLAGCESGTRRPGEIPWIPAIAEVLMRVEGVAGTARKG